MNLGRQIFGVLVAVASLGSGVLGDCDHRAINKIVKSWNGKTPHKVLKRSVGDMTYVYLSPTILKRDDARVYCVATRLAEDATTATDFYVHRDLVNKYTTTYKKVENTGKITLKGDNSLDESQYVISFKNHVLVFWQCIAEDKSGKYDGVVGIAVDVNHLKVAKPEIVEAKKTLKSLGLNNGEDLTPCSPEILKNLKKN